MDLLLPPTDGPAQMFYQHRAECPKCNSFDGQVSNLGELCLRGTRALKDDWAYLEELRRRARAAA